jgi:UDP-2,4-diacetamido-2,4,6-trideoxy-beta-L-altropyranose hydrolase
MEGGWVCHFRGHFDTGATRLLGSSRVPFVEIVQNTGGEEDAADTVQAIRDHHAAGVVLDSYLIDDAYIEALGEKGAPVLVIDDFKSLERYACAALLNFTLNASHLGYPNGDRLCMLGPGFFLARKRLRHLRRNSRRPGDDVHRVLVAMGGRDPLDLSGRVVPILWSVDPKLSVHVVVGDDSPRGAELASRVARFHGEGRVLIQLPDLAEEFLWADICVCSGGMTKYEAAFLGVPAAVLSQNPGQALDTVCFEEKGLSLNLGLGTEASDSEVTTRLLDFIGNRELRQSLNKAGTEFFPEDPTGQAAQAFAGIVRQQG